MDKRIEENAARIGRAQTNNRALSERRLNHFDYFTEVEDFFVRRRGKTLLLSPMDWALIESWKEKGVPLHVALRGIERAFDSYDKRPPSARRRSIKTLLYCEEEVEAQYAEWLESQTGQYTGNGSGAERKTAHASSGVSVESNGSVTDAGFPPQIVLNHLASRRYVLAELCASKRGGEVNLSLDFCEALERVKERLDELIADWQSSAHPSAERLEDALTQLERLLDENLLTCFSRAELAAERDNAKQQLAAYKARMESSTYETTLTHLLMKRLRERCGVPRLSLFHL